MQRQLPNETLYTEALLIKNGDIITWGQALGSQLTLLFSYNLPKFVDFAAGIGSFSAIQRQLTATAMKMWSSVANVHFKRSDTNYRVQLFEAERSGGIGGGYTLREESKICFSSMSPCYRVQYRNYLVINRDAGLSAPFLRFVASGDQNWLFPTLVHELGHTLGLEHPFSNLHAAELVESKDQPVTRAFSIMNYSDRELYERKFFLGWKRVYERRVKAISPTCNDIRAAQVLFGVPIDSGRGSNTYHLAQRANFVDQLMVAADNRDKSAAYTIETLYDPDGVNTLSAAGISEDVEINLNSGLYYRSKFKKHLVSLFQDFNNAVGGQGHNILVGNALNNVFDITETHVSATIVTHAVATGYDVVEGFHPQSDKIILEQLPQDPVPRWKLIVNAKGTLIQIDEKNSVLLAGVHPEQLGVTNVEVKPVTPDELLNRETIIAEQRISGRFVDALIPSFMNNFWLSAADYSGKKMDLAIHNLESIKKIGQLGIWYSTSSWRAAVINMSMTIFFSGRYSNIAITVAGLAADVAIDIAFMPSRTVSTLLNSVLNKTAQMGASVLGGYVAGILGNKLGLFTARKLMSSPLLRKVDAVEDHRRGFVNY